MIFSEQTELNNPSSSWEDSFLNWFSTLDIPMIETKLKLGGLEYYHFASLVKDHPSKKLISGFGSHQSRKLAAIKCAAETLERIQMLDYFSKSLTVPVKLQTSNGWAVHSSANQAKDKALAEATERHLLLKSFFRSGWNGFKLIQTIETENITLYLVLGKYTYKNQVSVLVAARSKKFSGVSFGYGLGMMENLNSSDFWSAAIFEAVDRILVPSEAKESSLKDNWIRQELNQYLNNSFDFSVLKENTHSDFFEAESEFVSVEFTINDLSKKYGLPFSLYSAFVKSDDLIPLFTTKHLNQEALAYLKPILEKHKIFELPEGHPIL